MYLDKWINNNKEDINLWLTNKDYKSLLNAYYKATDMSLVKFASYMKCSRRAMGRYLAGERLVPMNVIKKIIDSVGIIYKDNEENTEFNENGQFIWYGDNDMLFNILYLYRVKELKISRFQASCNLNIPCDTLKLYENGKKRIPHSDLCKIMEIYNLKVEELFPSLISYDGRKTFIPLHPVYEIKLKDGTIEELEDIYCSAGFEELFVWAGFPVRRYDVNGTPLLNYMPEELTLDEFINTDSLYFFDDLYSNSSYTMDFSDKKLPPNYRHILKAYESSKREFKWTSYEPFSIIVPKINFLDDYKVELCVNRKNIFDLYDYVFSDSKWYSMLQDEEYFRRGVLTYVGEKRAINQCIVWEDGQYVRIIELYKDKYPKRHYEEDAGVCPNDRYDVWVKYELPNKKMR